MSNLNRNGTISRVNGNYLSPGAGYFVNAYAPGAIARDVASSGGGETVIPIYDGSDIVAGEYLMKSLDTSSIYLVNSVNTSVSGSNTVTVDGEIVTSVDGTVFFNIGQDTGGGAAPTWIQTGTPNRVIYESPDTSDPITNSVVTCDSSGNFAYFYPVGTIIWELVRDTSGAPISYFPFNTAAGVQSSSIGVDNAIARYDGVTGTIIQAGYSSNTPSISDAGAITAAGAHTLGSITVTSGVAVGTTLTVGGATTLGDNVADATAIVGAATVGAGLTVTGTTALAVATVSSTLVVTGLATMNGGVLVAHLDASTGGTPTVGAITNFGTSPSGAVLGTAEVGKNTRCTVQITAGSGTGTNPGSFVLNYGKTYTTVPWVQVVQDVSGTGTLAAGGLGWVAGLSSVTVTFRAASSAAATYLFRVLVIQ